MQSNVEVPAGIPGEVLDAITDSRLQRITTHHERAVGALTEAVEAAIACGEELRAAKAEIAHGGWGDFIKELPFSQRTAQGYVQLADHSEAARRVAHLGIRGALKALAEPKKMAEPKDLADAIIEAPAEVQREIADEIVKSNTTDPSLKRVAEGPKRHPRPEKPTEQILSGAVFDLWNVQERIKESPEPEGENRVRMISSAQKAQRLATSVEYLLTTESDLDNVLDEITKAEVTATEKLPAYTADTERRKQIANKAKGRVDNVIASLEGYALGGVGHLRLDRALAVATQEDAERWVESLSNARRGLRELEKLVIEATT
jgi:hypothetical protein